MHVKITALLSDSGMQTASQPVHILQHDDDNNNNKQDTRRKWALFKDQVRKKKQRVPPCLSVCEVVLAELFPQQTVLSKKPQLRRHLTQADQVPAVRQALHDIELQAGRQVGQHHASS